MLHVRPALSEAEVREAAVQCWPAVQDGQVTFPLSGQEDVDALATTWLRTFRHTGDEILLVYAGTELAGACGVFHGEDTLQTVNGPIALRDAPAVFEAVFGRLAERHPGTGALCGVSHRNGIALGWLHGHAVAMAHSYPATLDLAAWPGALPQHPVHLAAPAEQGAFAEVYDAGTDGMYWTAARIIDDWDRWLVLADAAWRGCLACRLIGAEAEVFATVSADQDLTRSLLRGLLTALRRRGIARVVCFADDMPELSILRGEGFTCDDEYLLYRVSSPG